MCMKKKQRDTEEKRSNTGEMLCRYRTISQHKLMHCRQGNADKECNDIENIIENAIKAREDKNIFLVHFGDLSGKVCHTIYINI